MLTEAHTADIVLALDMDHEGVCKYVDFVSVTPFCMLHCHEN
jgi:hypothetical protein